MTVNNKLRIIIILTFATRLILLFAANSDLKMNPDEEANYQIALNYENGNGFTLFDNERKSFVPSSFHSSFPAFIYGYLIKYEIREEIWTLFIYALSLILFIL